jgi:hypothetical protein
MSSACGNAPFVRTLRTIPGSIFAFVSYSLLSPAGLFDINQGNSNKGAGVPFYDSIASYDSGLLQTGTLSLSRLWRRKREVKRRPLIGNAFGPDAAAVAMDDALNDR